MGFDVLQVTFLALIQGLTEFLPISSSAHLILPSAIFAWPDQGLAFDVAVHFGTLTAVILFFRQDISLIFMAWCRNVSGGTMTDNSRLGWMIIVATIPVVVAGLLLKDLVDQYLRSAFVIACTTIIFGLLLLYSDFKSNKTIQLKQMGWKACMLIAFSQVIALIPGTSRSGITMTAALLCNLDRESASRFSFLLSIPAISGAALLLSLDLLELPEVNWFELFYAMVLAAVTAYLCIHYFLKSITSLGFMPFVLYRLALGAVLFLIIF